MAEWFTSLFEGLWLRTGVSRRAEAEFVRRALKLRKGHRALDAPCGDGGVAIHLAEAGIRVTGVDITRSFVARARRRFAKRRLPGEFRICDLRRIDYEGMFEGVYNWFGSFGYFSDAENVDVLLRFARALRPGGRLLIDQINREFVRRHFRPRHKRGDVTVTVKWRPETQRVDATWTHGSGRKRRSCRSSIRLYTQGQFRRLFERAGLGIVATYGDWDGGPYRRSCPRIVIVGRKGR